MEKPAGSEASKRSGAAELPAIVRAAQAPTVTAAASAYAALGFSVLPLRGKVPALTSWKPYQNAAAPPGVVETWARAGLFYNVGLVCGAGSDGLVVLDLDGEAAYAALSARFPDLAATYTVATGSGRGRHLYYRCARPPCTARALRTPLGNLELCAHGRQVVAPPSTHPLTRRPYTVWLPLEVLAVPDLDALCAWIAGLCSTASMVTHPSAGRRVLPLPGANLPLPRLIDHLAAHFAAQGYRRHGDWLNGPCVYPQRHQHGDRASSFGFNTRTGYGHCFACGALLAKEIAAAVDLALPSSPSSAHQEEKP